jgi:hypothetical protein
MEGINWQFYVRNAPGKKAVAKVFYQIKLIFRDRKLFVSLCILEEIICLLTVAKQDLLQKGFKTVVKK